MLRPHLARSKARVRRLVIAGDDQRYDRGDAYVARYGEDWHWFGHRVRPPL
jgi:hypothetical protein